MARDFSQGALKRTEGPLDLALEGDGFFAVQTAEGERYTRDGRFALDGEGRLVTQTGDAVEGQGGAEIVLDAALGEVSVGRDGTVSQGGQIVGQVRVVRFDDRSILSKAGDGYYLNVSNLQPQDAPDVQVRQGMIEASNVQTIVQITRLIEVSRAYESTARMMDRVGELSSQSIQRLGRVN